MFSSNRTTTCLIGVVVVAPDATAAVAATELPGSALLELAEDTEMPITAAPTAAAVMAPASNLLPACNGAPLFRSRAAVRRMRTSGRRRRCDGILRRGTSTGVNLWSPRGDRPGHDSATTR